MNATRLSPLSPLPLAVLALGLGACFGSSSGNSSGGNGNNGGGGNGDPGISLTVNGNALSSGDTLSGFAAGETRSLVIANTSASNITVRPAFLNAGDDLDVRDFALGFDSDFAAGPAQQFDSPLQARQEDPVFGLVVEADPVALAALANLERVLVHDFALPDSEDVVLELQRVRLPVAADATLVVDGFALPGGWEQALAGTSVWRGRVVGDPASTLFLCLSPHGCRGWLLRADDLFHLGPQVDPSGTWRLARWTRESRLLGAGLQPPREARCSALPIPPQGPGAANGNGAAPGEPDAAGAPRFPAPGADPGGGAGQGTQNATGNALARIAYESDEDFLALFGGDVDAAAVYVAQLVAAVGHMYQSQVQTGLELAYLALYDAGQDPWVTPDGPSPDAVDMLEEFRDAWAGGWPVNADVATILVASFSGGGVAYVDSLCLDAWAFSASTGVTGAIAWNSFDFVSSPFYWDFIVACHEIGHNFGANHTHAYCPPFDTCASSPPNGSCSHLSDCGGTTKGTLMSYCHTCPPGLFRILPSFEPYIANVMREGVRNACFGAIQLGPGEQLEVGLQYLPQKSGNSQVEMRVFHAAANASSPFRLNLAGSN